jgi:hypothetical protein
MDDVYCPVCRLVLERRGGGGQLPPPQCPRCSVRRGTLVAMLALDQLPLEEPVAHPARPLAIAGPRQAAPQRSVG